MAAPSLPLSTLQSVTASTSTPPLLNPDSTHLHPDYIHPKSTTQSCCILFLKTIVAYLLKV